MADSTLFERQNDELEVLKAIYIDDVVDLRNEDVWKVLSIDIARFIDFKSSSAFWPKFWPVTTRMPICHKTTHFLVDCFTNLLGTVHYLWFNFQSKSNSKSSLTFELNTSYS